MSTHKTSEITKRDHAINAFQAILLGIPGVGGSLDKLLFGAVQEKRSRRIEHTLNEIWNKLEEKGVVPPIDDNEDLANFLEDVLPGTAKAANEDRRMRFRNLIFNAIQLPDGDSRWTEAKMATDLFEKVDDVGLELLSYFYKCEAESGSNVCAIALIGDRWCFGTQNPEESFSKAEPFHAEFPPTIIPASYPVIVRSMESLRANKLLTFGDSPVWFEDVFDGGNYDLLMNWIICSDFDGLASSDGEGSSGDVAS